MELYEEQKIALFEASCFLPDFEVVKRNTHINDAIEEIKNRPDEEFVSKGLQRRMIENYKKQGLNEKEAMKQIKQAIELKRKVDLDGLERMKGV